MRITSTRNPIIKYVRSLERAAVRRADGVYLAEGVRLVREAVDAQQPATLVLYDPDLLRKSTAGSLLLPDLPAWAGRSFEVDEHVLAAAAQTETPAGVVAVLRRPEPASLASHDSDHLGLVLDRLADPGNAGTILRTANAAGVAYVAALPGTVDLFAPKVVRAGMGAHFRLPLFQPVSEEDLKRALPDVTLVAIDMHGTFPIAEFVWPERTALLVGSEAHGLSPAAESLPATTVRIPMREGAESLNAAVAASIAIYAAAGWA